MPPAIPASDHAGPIDPRPSVSLARLAALAEELAAVGLSARVRAVPGRIPCLQVVNPLAARLAERVYAARARDGAWWYWWPWRERIAPVDDASSAAHVIARVLALRDG